MKVDSSLEQKWGAFVEHRKMPAWLSGALIVGAAGLLWLGEPPPAEARDGTKIQAQRTQRSGGRPGGGHTSTAHSSR